MKKSSNTQNFDAKQTCTFPSLGVAVTVGVKKLADKTVIAGCAHSNDETIGEGLIFTDPTPNSTLLTPNSQLKPMTSIELAKALTDKTNVEYIPMGGTTVARRRDDGTFEVVESTDPVVAAIMNRGQLYNQHLFKQHVLAQFLRQQTEQCPSRNYIGEYIFDKKGHYVYRDKSYQEVINDLHYEYMLTMLRDELLRQMVQEGQHDDNFQYNNRWFNKQLVASVITHYADVALKQQIERCTTKHCQGQPYKVVAGLSKAYPEFHRNMIFESAIPGLLAKYKRLAARISRRCSTAEELFHLYNEFFRHHIKIQSHYRIERCGRRIWQHVDTPLEWRDAYKGYGAFWSMQNLIEFHDCHVFLHVNGHKHTELNRTESINYLQVNALMGYGKCGGEKRSGWWFTGMIRQLMKDNNIDPKQMLDSWKRR